MKPSLSPGVGQDQQIPCLVCNQPRRGTGQLVDYIGEQDLGSPPPIPALSICKALFAQCLGLVRSGAHLSWWGRCLSLFFRDFPSQVGGTG